MPRTARLIRRAPALLSVAALTAAAADPGINTPAPVTNGVPFVIPVAFLEGAPTSDGRYAEPGAVVPRALPQTLAYLDATPDWGHIGAIGLGRIDEWTRIDVSALSNPATGLLYGDNVWGWRGVGRWADTDAGRAAARSVAEMVVRGISADLAVTDYEWRVTEVDEDGWPIAEDLAVLRAELAMATVCTFPAFAGCYIYVDPADVDVAPGDTALQPVAAAALTAAAALPAPVHGNGVDGDRLAARAIAAAATIPPEAWPQERSESLRLFDAPASNRPLSLVASAAAEDRPDPAWFADPGLDGPTPLTVTPDGRVFGHLARWDIPHVGVTGDAVYAPRSDCGYAYFLTGAMLCADGAQVRVGHLTAGTGHATTDPRDPASAYGPAVAHYDDTGWCAAYVACGEDAHGIWVAGITAPGAAEEQITTLRAHPLSGDWRVVAGRYQLIAALSVNTNGFPIAAAAVSGGQPYALVAAGVVPLTTAPAVGPDGRISPASYAASIAQVASAAAAAAAAAAIAPYERDRRRSAALADLRRGRVQ